MLVLPCPQANAFDLGYMSQCLLGFKFVHYPKKTS